MSTTTTLAQPLTRLKFDNSYARLPAGFFERVAATPLPNPQLVHFNADVAALIDLEPTNETREAIATYVAGAQVLPGSDPVAMAYAGHQFGNFVPSLGDGRALLLGEVVNGEGQRWDLHLKGSGKTPYSRGFDGRSVLRSALREYVAGEALHQLGIPTTRALALVSSPEPVLRETMERAGSLLRVASSHVRFGTYQWFHHRKDTAGLQQLTDYVVNRHFPQWEQRPDRAFMLLRETVHRTASLVAQWQSVGFTHGVLNTVNMSLLGLTLDYGPYGFVEAYEHAFVPNLSDELGRYAFNRQPAIAHWNLTALADAMGSLLEPDQAEEALASFAPAFADAVGTLFRAKLGLRDSRNTDDELVGMLLAMAEADRADFTLMFRALGGITSNEDVRGFARMFDDRERSQEWLTRYRARFESEGGSDGERQERLDAVNPLYVLRHWVIQRAIAEADAGRLGELERLLAVLGRPYVEQQGAEAYAGPAPKGLSVPPLSCSS